MLVGSVMLFGSGHACLAQWTKTIDCPVDRVYREIRKDAGRQEFCEQVLPGSMTVKDGPFRFWFNQNFQGAAGNYSGGREVGIWKECDRFGRCEQKDHPAIYPEEKQRPGFKPEIPVSFVEGKYVFDFASCRGTEITHTAYGEPDFNLSFGTIDGGCFINYSPEEDWFWQELHYTCTIPFQVGKSSFGSLDLISEFPKLGLPQYCIRQAGPVRGPSAMSVSPSTGGGLTQIFTAEYDTGTNGLGIAQARLHFQESAASRTDRCVVRYDPATKNLYLLSDQDGKYLGPIAAGGKESLWNSRCLLSACSNARLRGTRLSVRFAIRFNPALFAGWHKMYLEIVDTQKHSARVVPYHAWNVPSQQSTTPSTMWPEDRSCPTAPTPRFSEHCSNVSGKWSDWDTGGVWSLTQTGDKILGSFKTAKAGCGVVSWRVAGEMKDGLGTLRATEPQPSVDGCGVVSAASITATIVPDCINGTRVEIQPVP